jgi:peptidoglycan/xylan/chitin deacetylase (PgdA/CDA1 family)
MVKYRVVVVALVWGCSSPAQAPVDGAVVVDSDAAVIDAAVVVDAAVTPLSLTSITPAIGSVAGGEELTVYGEGFTSTTRVFLGDFECAPATVHSSQVITCDTHGTNFVEGIVDVSVVDGDQHASLAQAFTYQCPWLTTAGRRTCGAVPPPHVAEQPISSWITKFEAGHGFTANAGTSNLADTSDFVVGTQSVVIETDGTGTPSTLQKLGFAAIDFTDKDLKIWVKVENVTHMTALDVTLGDATLANAFRFRLRSSQGQQWMTDGDWVSFAVPWAATNYALIGTPNRAAISSISIRAIDDATGAHVKVHFNGLALTDEPVAKYPKGVVSFTFDDGFATMVSAGAPVLAQYGIPATAYVIVDMVDTPDYVTLTDLHTLQTAGWDIGVHANKDAHHAAHFQTLPPSVVEDDVVDALAWLIANGFSGYNHCAYPSGEYDADVLTIVGMYFTSCRTIYQRQQETYLPADARKLRVYYVTNNVPLENAKRAIDEAITSHDWVILVFHQLVAGTPTKSTEWNASDFATLAAYVAGSGVAVKPISAVIP